MTKQLRVLILDDILRWRKDVETAIEGLGPGVETILCPDLVSAENAIERLRFDLVIVDLSLLAPPMSLENPARPEDLDALGIDFLRALRSNEKNRHCAAVVLTGNPTTERLNLLLTKYAVYSVIQKDPEGFSDKAIQDSARGALREARMKAAAFFAQNEPRLTLRLGAGTIKEVNLSASDERSSYEPDPPTIFPWQGQTHHADLIELSLRTQEPGAWRKHVKELGTKLYTDLTSDPRIGGIFSAARYRFGVKGSRVRYCLASPSGALGLPFEMIRFDEQEDPICIQGPASRRIVYPGQMNFKKLEAFHHFLARLGDQGKALRILFVAANVDGKIPNVDKEVTTLQKQLGADFDLVGIPVESKVLQFSDATFERVKDLLSTEPFHVLHYAGHGIHQIDLPENSGLVLKDGNSLRRLTAANLKNLVEGTDLRMVFLSCCLGAKTSTQPGDGDFYGTLEALARGGVRFVLGYRWEVADISALHLAQSFYRFLSQTFSPEAALFKARIERIQEGDRNDPTWISPILLAQP